MYGEHILQCQLRIEIFINGQPKRRRPGGGKAADAGAQ
jgi:hypothetical protein